MRGIKTKESGKWKRVAVFLVLLLVFGFLLNSVRNVYKKKEMAQEVLTRMEKQAEELKSREAFLKESFARLGTKDGIEFEMRKKLNVAGAGESVAIIVDQKIPATAQTSATSPWQKVRDFLIGLFR